MVLFVLLNLSNGTIYLSFDISRVIPFAFVRCRFGHIHSTQGAFSPLTAFVRSFTWHALTFCRYSAYSEFLVRSVVQPKLVH